MRSTMYNMKNIVTFNEEIMLPKCMYRVKNHDQPVNELAAVDENEINISNQVMKFFKTQNKKMVELEERQDQLLKKLDTLYDKIKTISSICTTDLAKTGDVEQVVLTSNEIVLIISPDNLPWYLNILLKESLFDVNILWHIHSSVPMGKDSKINAFVTKLKNSCYKSTVTLRLIFKCGSYDSQLKLSSLALPIVGNVNILRYLSYIYPSMIPYDDTDYVLDGLLDICHVLERAAEKSREALIKKIFEHQKTWIHTDTFSIVDLLTYTIVKQWQNGSKYVPKQWYQHCEKKILNKLTIS